MSEQQTKDQIAAIMLLRGTPEQQVAALAYCNTPIPGEEKSNDTNDSIRMGSTVKPGLSNLLGRMGGAQALGAYQRQPDWIARFRLRPDYEPVEVGSRTLTALYGLGIRNFMMAQTFLQRWIDRGNYEIPGVFVLGTRDMCWQLSWLLEILEGRYEDDISDQYAPDYYINSRYGVDLYFSINWK